MRDDVAKWDDFYKLRATCVTFSQSRPTTGLRIWWQTYYRNFKQDNDNEFALCSGLLSILHYNQVCASTVHAATASLENPGAEARDFGCDRSMDLSEAKDPTTERG